MNPITEIKKIAFLGDYFPRKCGIATFTHDLRHAVAEQYPETESFVAPVNDLPEGYEYPGEVRFEFSENDLDSYRRTSDYLNFSNAYGVNSPCSRARTPRISITASSFATVPLSDLLKAMESVSK